MSSMRNAIPRRSHRERPQPHSRTRRGLLEKRKDYVLRSQDYKRKQSTLKRLNEKAVERNPDEFYYGMMNGKTQDGIPIASRPESRQLSPKEVVPLKMQDAAYLRTVLAIDRKRIEKLRNVVGISAGKGKRIVFAENEQEAEVLRNEKIATKVVVSQQGMSKEARELEARMARVKELEKMLRKVTLQVQLMGNGAVRKIRKEEDDSDDEEDTIPTYKWKPRRQK